MGKPHLFIEIMINKKRECLRCKEEMIEARIIAKGGISLMKSPINFFNNKRSYLTALVCPACGYVEWIAETPEVFTEKNN